MNDLRAALADRYRVERELGAGGMATVYLAHDLKHDRDVAIKVLHHDLGAALGSERFLSEIRTTARLQHPHILPLLDSGNAEGLLYYVMPYVTGETLRARLERERQLPIDDALRIAREVADALGSAHALGIIHRDIKPENILLQGGHALVADFGIALAVQQAGGQRMTQTGLSLGTPQYMSPEQAMGERAIDARTDIYALGAVTYEMLAGDPPFTGSSVQAIVAKVMTERPTPLRTLRDTVPDGVEQTVLKALAKLPADRFATAAEFAAALGISHLSIIGSTPNTTDLARELVRSHRALVALAAVAVIAIVAAILGWTGSTSSAFRGNAPPSKRMRFTLVVSDSAGIRPEVPGQNFAISPDGSQIVYRGGEATNQLYVRNLSDLHVNPIPGTERAAQTRFSPDGKWLAFIQGGQLKKIPLPGGPAVTVVDSAAMFGWGDDDVIVFVKHGALWRANAAGGAATLVALPDIRKSQRFAWPYVLPGAKAVVFDVVSGDEQANGQLAAARLDDGRIIQLGIIGRNPRYVATGHIVFGRLDGTVMAAPFDVRRLRVTGPAVTVLDNVYSKAGGAGEYGVARDGTLFYVQGTSEGELLQVDRAGVSRPLLTERRGYALPRYSPTSGRFAFVMPNRSSVSKPDVWVFNDMTRTVTRLTNDGSSTAPAWMADGERVVWLFRDSSGSHVRRQRWDGTGTPETLFIGEQNISAVVPAPAGTRFVVEKQGRFSDLYVADGDAASPLHPLVVTPAVEGGARFSRDGRWVAYFSDESGQREVYVIGASGDGGRHQISADGGGEPVWAPDGSTLYYRAGGKMMAAQIGTSPAFTVTSREALFTDHFRSTGGASYYDVSRDGKTFLMIGSSSEAAQRIVVVTGWLDELKERMAQAARK